MRKFSVIFMAAAVSFGLISCGGGGKSSADDPDIKSYTVKWNYNYAGAPAPVQESVQSGNLLTPYETVPEREGSYFTEKWYTEASCETEWNFDADTVTSDTVLYAGWKYKPYLVFRSTEPFSLSVSAENKGWDGTIDWSVDTEDWNTGWEGLSADAVKSSVNDYYYLYVRGKNNNKIAGCEEDSNHNHINKWTLEGSKVECWGSIMTLLNYEDPDSIILRNGEGGETVNEECFACLFEDCTCLTVAPELPASVLSSSCYNRMFLGCKGLTEAPLLPALKLAEDCYGLMFWECEALKTAPELPAEELYKLCYESMFYGCKGLETPPDLPASVMKQDCYVAMFKGCEKLKTAPALAAAELAAGCYNSMFWECTSLTAAPELPAEQLETECYAYMFFGCSSLNISSDDSQGTKILTVPDGHEDDVAFMFYGTAGIFSGGYGTPEPGTYYWN